MHLGMKTRGLLVMACTAAMWLPLVLPDAPAVAEQRVRRQPQDAARIHHLSVRDDGGSLGRDCLRMRGGNEKTSISNLIDLVKMHGRPADGAYAHGPGDGEGKDEKMQMLTDMLSKIDAQVGLEGGALNGRAPPLNILGDLMGGLRGPEGGGVLAQMGGVPMWEQKQPVEGEDEEGAKRNNKDSWNALWEEANQQGLQIPRNPQDVPPLNKVEAKKIFRGGGDEGLDDPLLRLVVDMVPGLNYLGNRKTLYPVRILRK